MKFLGFVSPLSIVPGSIKSLRDRPRRDFGGRDQKAVAEASGICRDLRGGDVMGHGG